MTQIISVSLTEQHKKYLEDNEFSPSAILRAAIQAKIDANESAGDVSTEKKLEIMAKRQETMLNYLQNRGMLDDFWNFKAKKEVSE